MAGDRRAPQRRGTRGIVDGPALRSPLVDRPGAFDDAVVKVLEGLRPGSYEIRARAVDRNGFAQPEPRPYPKSGLNAVPCQVFEVTA